MEIIFVTCDRSEDQFNGYFKEMPWFAIPFEAEDIRVSHWYRSEIQPHVTLTINIYVLVVLVANMNPLIKM